MKVVLTCDGGGFRAFMAAILAADLEETTGRPCADLFGLFCATSGGGILAAALAAGIPAAQVVEMMEDQGEPIFSASFWHRLRTANGWRGGPRYQPDALEDALTEVFGDVALGEPQVAPLILTSYDLDAGRPRMWKSHDAWDAGVRIRDAVMATTAAPTYFPPHRVPPSDVYVIDGGVVAVHPGRVALTEAEGLWPSETIVVVSLGTGKRGKGWAGQKATKWGRLEWLKPIIQILQDGPTDHVDYDLEKALGPAYHRIDQEVGGAMDDGSPEAVERLATAAGQLSRGAAWGRVRRLFDGDDVVDETSGAMTAIDLLPGIAQNRPFEPSDGAAS